MLWLELTKNPLHGGAGWEFGTCLWSPNCKKRGDNWPFWSALLSVRKGDSIAHLQQDGRSWRFVGISLARADGFATDERPPKPEESGFAKRFNRVDLESYQPFSTAIPLATVFEEQDLPLRAYFAANKARPKQNRKHIFFVIQSDRLQCLNGAYLSEVDDALADLLFGSDYTNRPSDNRISAVDVPTGETLRTLKARVGQQDFSAVVRNNFSHCCCFPQCQVADGRFLVGAHIARWADEKEQRGNPANGLCLCLMHDRAFEDGLFALDDEFRVVVPKIGKSKSSWVDMNLEPFAGQKIRAGAQAPSIKSIGLHRQRHGIYI